MNPRFYTLEDGMAEHTRRGDRKLCTPRAVSSRRWLKRVCNKTGRDFSLLAGCMHRALRS